MLMRNFGVTNKEHYGILWYFLEWSIRTLVEVNERERGLELNETEVNIQERGLGIKCTKPSRTTAPAIGNFRYIKIQHDNES